MNTLTVLTQAGGFSGIDGPLIQHLGAQWRVLRREVPPMGGLARVTDLALSVSFPLRKWKRRFASRQSRRPKRVADFLARTQAAERLLSSCLTESDVVLQVSSLFAAGASALPVPYVLYLDLTTAQAMRLYPPWSPRESEREAWLALENEVYHRASRVLVMNGAAAEALRVDYGVPSERIATVGTGFAPPARLPMPAARRRLLLFISNDPSRHGLATVLAVHARLRACAPDVLLRVVGTRVTGPGVASDLMMDHAQLTEAYREAAALLTLGPVGGAQSALEAMACGCIPVARRTNPHVGDLAAAHGVALDSDDPATIAAAVLEVLDDAAGWRERSDRCRRAACADYRWEVVAGRIDRELRQTLSQARRTVRPRPGAGGRGW